MESNKRKRSCREIDSNDLEKEESVRKKSKNFFCVHTFRDQLKRPENVSVFLRDFVKMCSNKEQGDIVMEYLEAGGSVHEILQVLDKSAKLDLSSALLVFRALDVIFLRIKDADSKFKNQIEEGVNSVLNSFIPTIDAMMNINSNKFRKAVLKFLTTSVSLSPKFTREIFNLIPTSPTVLRQMLQPTSGSDTTRKWFIMFILSFMVSGDITIIQSLLSIKGLMGDVLMNLTSDSSDTINIVLAVIKEKILENQKISKTLKLNVFNTQVIIALFNLYEWKGIGKSKKALKEEEEERKAEKELVTESVDVFLHVLCTSRKFGVAFYDASFGTSRESKNSLLATVLQSIPEPWNNEKKSEIVKAIVVACPDLLKLTLNKMESVLVPRESEQWSNAIGIVERIYETLSPKEILMKSASEVSQTDTIRLAKDFCTPTVLFRNLGSGLEDKSKFVIMQRCMKIVTLLWRRTEEVLVEFENDLRLKKALLSSFKSVTLESDDILELWRNTCKDKVTLANDQSFIHVILDYVDISSKLEDENMDSCSFLNGLMLQILDEYSENFDATCYTIVRCRIFSELAKTDPMSLLPETDLFRKAIILLLENVSDMLLRPISQILLSSGVFENNESEVDIWLGCYFNRIHEFKEWIPSFFADCIVGLYRNECHHELDWVEDGTRKKSVINDLMDFNSEQLSKRKWTSTRMGTPTPMLLECMKRAKSSASESKEKMKSIRRYIEMAVIRLYHFYDNSVEIMKIWECERIEVPSPISSLTKNHTCFVLDSENRILFTAAEKKLVSCLFDSSSNPENVQEILLEFQNNSLLSSFMSFKLVCSILMSELSSDSFCDDVFFGKMSQILNFFMNLVCLDERELKRDELRVISRNANSYNFFRNYCFECFFSLPLINYFNVHETENKNIINFTKLLVSVIKTQRTFPDYSVILQPWKECFLTEFKTNVDRKIELNTVDPGLLDEADLLVCHCLGFESREIIDVLDICCSSSDMNVFVGESAITLAALIFVKFIKLNCVFGEVERKAIHLLRKIMDIGTRRKVTHLEVVDEGFLYLLKRRPKSASSIVSDLLEGLLGRVDSNPHLKTIGRILLSDPVNVSRFLRYSKDHRKNIKNKRMLISMLSVIVRKEDHFFELLRSYNFCSYWKEDEILKDSGSDLSEITRQLFQEYLSRLFSAESSNREEAIAENRQFFSLILKCYLEKDVVGRWMENISNGLFEPDIVHGAMIKLCGDRNILESYVKGLFRIFQATVKKGGCGKLEEAIWAKYGEYVGDLLRFRKESKWSQLSDFVEWKEFLRICLRKCLSCVDCPSFLKTATRLIQLLYESEGDSTDAADLFRLLISHSQFVNVMLQQKSVAKSELAKLYFNLIKMNPKVLSEKHVPVILASYTATLSDSDSTLFDILKYYEENGVKMDDYEPVVWGEPAVDHYSVRTDASVSLWRRINMINVLTLLDPKLMERSLQHFPVDLEPKTRITDEEDVYDPRFLLSVFSKLLSPGAVVYCLPFIQKGCFAFALRSLSSNCRDIRISASVVLSRFHGHLELARNMKLKSVWLHFINSLRYGIERIEDKPLPSVVTYFLAKMSLELSGEPGEMFTSLQNYLLARSAFDFNSVPEFLPMFHGSDVHYVKQRRWILRILRDGFRSKADADVLFQTMALKMLFSHFVSSSCTRESRLLVLETITNILKTEGAELLLTEYGLLTWISGICSNCEKELFIPLILNVLVKILPNLLVLRSKDALHLYLGVLLENLITLLRYKDNNWCVLNKEKIGELARIATAVDRPDESLEENRHFSDPNFFLVFSEESNRSEELFEKVVFLWNVLIDWK